MSKQYADYRGFRNVVAAEVTQDNSAGYVGGKWRELEGAVSMSLEISETSTPYFRDNKAVGSIFSEGADVATVNMDVLANKVRAWIEGRLFSEKTGALIKAPKKNKTFALGCIAGKTDGTEEAIIMYSTSVTSGSEEHATEDDGTDATTMEYTFTGAYTKSRFALTIDGQQVSVAVKSYRVPLTDDLTEEMIFGTFTDGESTLEVLTPDAIEALVTA